MGYFASGSGNILFTNSLNKEQQHSVQEYLRCVGFNVDISELNDEVYFWLSGKWNSSVEEALNDIAKNFEILSGSAEFIGEEGDHWREEYDQKSLSWKEIYGRVIYENEPFIYKRHNAEFIGNIIDIFEDFLESKGIDIPNEDKEQSDNPAIIYGMDYGDLSSRLESMMEQWGIIEIR